jgi:hypothetical protein
MTATVPSLEEESRELISPTYSTLVTQPVAE